jgi:excinuclease UvrABC helicase subunit UvrB
VAKSTKKTSRKLHAISYTTDKFQHHWSQIVFASLDVVEYMNTHHNHLWSISMLSNEIKCDYVNNNIAKSCNKWIKKIKVLPLVEFIARLRQMTIATPGFRRQTECEPCTCQDQQFMYTTVI